MITKRKRIFLLIAVFAMAGMATTVIAGPPDHEAYMYYESVWDDYCNCMSPRTNNFYQYASENVFDTVTSHSKYDDEYHILWSHLIMTRFEDADAVATGEDHNFIDKGDLGTLGTHGNFRWSDPDDDPEPWLGFMSRYAKNWEEECLVNQDQMWYGDTDLEWLVFIGACFSTHKCVIDKWPMHEGLHSVHGVHGATWLTGSGDYTSFASDALDEPIWAAYQDNLKDVNGYTQCTTSYFKASGKTYLNWYMAENLTSSYPDSPGSVAAIKRIENCDPLDSGLNEPWKDMPWEQTDCN